ncbi:plasmid pRiA4b ORF-3 family protein [Vineibacter terrae]|uniref:plasmid pRiA4b ORF-3 family protein n=1 Tax=Vineibacter terrae TaxID=2586908 RepID=UPI002E32338F|nr:plasmid pRiA4b ORF-3 family protein [Vineibacter terrae]HEX2886437.1 plasmid pRiA4b ORF-3 family protein [Vineibacter terrae]
MSTADIFCLKVTLDDVEPQVLRRIEVPANIKLDRLHLTLQAALGWTNSHLYEIRVRDTGWGLPESDWPDGPLDARKAKLIDVLEDIGTKALRYLYDFGDGWEHTIKVERVTASEPGVAYPRLTEASGRCPPEDVGGPWGYAEMLEALDNPQHERHAEIRAWVDDDFDPRAFDPNHLKAEVAKLARRWSRKPPARKTRMP